MANIPMTSVDVLDSERCELGEGPIWDDRSEELLWVDIVRRQVHHRSLDGPRSTVTFEEAVGAVALCRDGGWLLSLEHGPARSTRSGDVARLAWFADADPGPSEMPVRANDAACAPDGRFFAGTMAWDASASAGALYRLDPGGGPLVRVLDGVTISNGIGWSPDGRTMYYVDTRTQRVDMFAYDTGTGSLADRRPGVDIDPRVGAPDGLTVDAAGAIWVALWGGGAVHRYAPDGRLDRVLELPCTQVTSCTFAGAQLDRLAVTSAFVDLDRPQELAGATFVADVGVTGLPTNRYDQG